MTVSIIASLVESEYFYTVRSYFCRLTLHIADIHYHLRSWIGFNPDSILAPIPASRDRAGLGAPHPSDPPIRDPHGGHARSGRVRSSMAARRHGAASPFQISSGGNPYFLPHIVVVARTTLTIQSFEISFH